MGTLVFVTEFTSVCWIGPTKSAGFVVQRWVLVCWWCPGRSGLCGGGILRAEVYPESCPLSHAMWLYRYFLLHLGHSSPYFHFFLNSGMNGVGGGVGVTG